MTGDTIGEDVEAGIEGGVNTFDEVNCCCNEGEALTLPMDIDMDGGGLYGLCWGMVCCARTGDIGGGGKAGTIGA